MLSRLALLPALLLVGACSSETAILIAVSGSAVEELEFHVSALVNDGTGAYVLDEDLSDRVNVHGRNLRARPFELLLREEDTTGKPLSLRVLALAYTLDKEGNSKQTGFAITEPPQRFIREEVVRRSISISSFNKDNPEVDARNACFFVRSGKEGKELLDLTTVDDRDCDGSVDEQYGGDDCDSEDPAINPKAKEICDGKDNNCDGSYLPVQEFDCYTTSDGKCYSGKKTCDDKTGKATTQCSNDTEQAIIHCLAFEKCGMECVEKIKKLSCEMHRTKTGELCPGGLYELDTGAAECDWKVVNNVDVTIAIKATEGACKAKLVVAGAEKEKSAGRAVVVEGKQDVMFDVSVKLITVADCPSQPLSCAQQ